MSSKTETVVLRMKETICTAIFVGLAILLIILCFIMFCSRKDVAAVSTNVISYVSGVYNATLALGSENVNVGVTMDADRINFIDPVPLSKTVTTMYPLIQPALDDLASQIVSTQSTGNLTYPNASRYTSATLLSTISMALDKAKVD